VPQGSSVSCATFQLAGVSLELDSDDDPLIAEAAALLGAPVPGPSSPRRVSPLHEMRARVRAAGGAHVRLELTMPRAEQRPPADLLLAAGSADFPFDLLESSGDRVVLARRGSLEPAIVAGPEGCLFALEEGWRKALALLLLQRLMRCREDAVFFHAGSVSVRGAGAMVVGPKGAGKSTLVLALAARGHALLGDEHACYLPATGELLPFRRPVGIKPGPRSSAVEDGLARRGRSPERDGMMRLPLEDLLDALPAATAALRAVVFLDGFAAAPRLRVLEPSRVDLGRLQPVGASMVNAPRTRRVFEMARLLSRSRVYELVAGPPDETAATVEEALRAA
jgi:hypothetical protein